MSPHYTKVVILISEQDKEHRYSYCTCFFVSGVLLLFLSNWVSHHDQRNLQTHHTILATLLIYLPWLVVCIVHHRHYFLFMTDGTSNTKKWLAILTLLLPGIDRVIILQLQPSPRNHQINPSWLFVLLIFQIDGTIISDWHVCLDLIAVLLATAIQLRPLSFFFSTLNIICLFIVWVYSPTKQHHVPCLSALSLLLLSSCHCTTLFLSLKSILNT